MAHWLVGVVVAWAALNAPGAVSRPRFDQSPAREISPKVFPGVQPQLAADGDRVFLTFGRDNVISVVSSEDGGQTFGEPVTIVVPGRVALGMHRGPRIAATPSAVMVSVVAGAKGGGADGDILLYRSADRGVTWAPAVIINDVPGAAREGLHAMAANEEGLAMMAWLDLREKGTRIYSAISRTHGVAWSADELVYASPSGSVCECCHPSIALGSGLGGRARAIMFRNSVDGNRDMYVVRAPEGGSYLPAQQSGSGSWKLDACPMDGGAIALNGRGVVAVWRREDGVYLNTLGSVERRIGTGRDPVISRTGAHQDIAWSGPAGIMLSRGTGVPTTLGDGRFPSVLALEGRTVLAWEHQGTVMVATIPR